ncbi:hypothetical protein D3C71_2009710 [compost metagenome]
MLLALAGLLTLRLDDFRGRLNGDEPPGRSGLHLHYGGTDYGWCESDLTDQELAVFHAGRAAVLYCRLYQRLSVRAALDAFLPEAD